MLTTREAARLLAAADSVEGLTALVHLAGCSSAPAPLDAETARALGIAGDALRSAVCTGPGALRALLLEAAGAKPVRILAEATAAKLARRTPHVLWLIAITQAASGALAVVAWSGGGVAPRIRALVCDRARIVDSDAETLRAIAAASGDGDLMTHARWVELLGRETLTRRFYAVLHDRVQDLAASGPARHQEEMRALALLHVSRLLFLAFLQAKGWLDGDHAFLARQFDRCMAGAGAAFHTRVLLPLFFGTLNTPAAHRAPRARAFGRVPFLNGGLFTRTPLERRWREVAFADAAYGTLLTDVFGQYRFTAREDQATWSEAAVDPEMLGRAFEGLMANTDRKASGTFFTPQPLVQRLTDATLRDSLARVASERDVDAVLRDEPLAAAAAGDVRAHLEGLTLVDPACGSGAFLVNALERIASLLVSQGDGRAEVAVRRMVLARSIFGVDANPTAVWLCELRLWLSVLIDCDETDPLRVPPLPNLDLNIRVGDALSGEAFAMDADPRARVPGAAGLRRLRERYTRSTGPRKATLARELSRRERMRALAELDAALHAVRHRRLDLLSARRAPTLFGERGGSTRDQRDASRALRERAAGLRRARARIAGGGALPFSWSVYFADIAAGGGFGVVLGNPPWVRLHEIPAETRMALRERYAVARAAPWAPPGATERRPPGFGAQLDLAAVFVERACQLARARGSVGLLVPSKLWSSLAGAGVRRLVAARSRLACLEDLTDASDGFDAAVYPSMLIARSAPPRSSREPASEAVIGVHHRGAAMLQWRSVPELLPYDDSPGAPWLLLPPAVRHAFDKVRGAGVPLGASGLGTPRLGVKCGSNEAFLVRLVARDGELAIIEDSAGKRAWIEHALLRPLIRGDSVTAWAVEPDDARIVWTHAPDGAPLRELPQLAARWFARRRTVLQARTDARRTARWWSLFRIEAGRTDRPRAIWCDMGRSPRAAYLAPNDDAVPLNTCYAVRCADDVTALALVALLNTPLAGAWLGAIAEPARGGYRRYLGWTTSLLPIPQPWERVRPWLADLTVAALAGNPPPAHALMEAACAAYCVRARDVEPLVAWSGR